MINQQTLNKIPLYVKAGSLIPMSNDQGTTSDLLHIYEGADGNFSLYLDNGTDYSYEDGDYSIIPMEWKDATHQLTFLDQQGTYDYPTKFYVTLHRRNQPVVEVICAYDGK